MVGDRARVVLQPLRDLLGKDVEEKGLDALLSRIATAGEGHQQQHGDERDGDDVQDVERPDECAREVGALRPNNLGEDERQRDRGHERAEPGPCALRAAERDRPQRRQERPQDDRARLLEAADHDQPERGRDQNEEELRGPQKGEVPRPGEDDEADDRAGDIAPRGERDGRLADEPVHEPPREAGREDEERDADQEPLAEAQVRRVGWIGADRQRTFDELARPPRRHDARG